MKYLAVLAVITVAPLAMADVMRYQCDMADGNKATFQTGPEVCAFNGQQGQTRPYGQCFISNPQLRIVTLNARTGEITYEDTDNDKVTKGICKS
ncbi:MAG: hypothetical protein CML57_11170 [Rhodobacteraceae bacterium]|nr:hypothetical protein [Paracoccaceae bacterium]